MDLLYDMSYWSLVILKSSNDEMSMGAQAKHLLQVIIDKRDLCNPIILLGMIAVIQKSEHLEHKIV